LKGVFISDCEGPISKNDNAFELTEHVLPNGDSFFSLISKYDDVLADVLKRPGYNAGDTLKLILPFLKAYDVTDERIREFSFRTLRLISGSKETLSLIRSLTDAFIVSTSYEHYIKALCEFLNFPFVNTYCTRLAIDGYPLALEEKKKLKTLAEEIAFMPMITIPPLAKSIEDFATRDQELIRRLDQIFWETIAGMSCGRIFSEVKTVGGEQKAEAIRDITKRLQVPLSNVTYVGDSITDVQAFQLIRNNGGLTISFNGNSYAVKNAEIVIQAENNLVTAILTDVFLKHGKSAVLQLVENWNVDVLASVPHIEPALLNHVFPLYQKALPKVQIVTPKNMDSLIKESSGFRKKVRGETVGKLG
jgi:energy-converting hydrogenase A subunit R